MAFYIQQPEDEYGNVRYTPAIIEAEPWGGNGLMVIAPVEFQQKWPTVRSQFFMPCDGPARILSHEEHRALIAEMRAATRAGEVGDG